MVKPLLNNETLDGVPEENLRMLESKHFNILTNQDFITGNQAKQARLTLLLSQSKVAKECGINRSYLSQFEHGHRKLSEPDLETLHDYFSSEDEDDTVTPQEEDDQSIFDVTPFNRFKKYILDDFVISPQVDEVSAENLIDEYHALSDHMEQFYEREPVKSWFYGVSKEETLEKALPVLLAAYRQHVIIQTLLNKPREQDSKPIKSIDDVNNIKDFLCFLLSNENNPTIQD